MISNPKKSQPGRSIDALIVTALPSQRNSSGARCRVHVSRCNAAFHPPPACRRRQCGSADRLFANLVEAVALVETNVNRIAGKCGCRMITKSPWINTVSFTLRLHRVSDRRHLWRCRLQVDGAQQTASARFRLELQFSLVIRARPTGPSAWRYSRSKNRMASGSSRIRSVFGSIRSFRPPSRQLMLA